MWEKLAWAAGGLVAGAAAVLGAEYLASSGPARDRTSENARRRKARRAAHRAVKMLTAACKAARKNRVAKAARKAAKPKKKPAAKKVPVSKPARKGEKSIAQKATDLAQAMRAAGAQASTGIVVTARP